MKRSLRDRLARLGAPPPEPLTPSAAELRAETHLERFLDPAFMGCIGTGVTEETACGPAWFVSHRSHGVTPHGHFAPAELDRLCTEHVPDGLGALAGQPGLELSASDVLFLDIETTGLSGGAGTLAFLIGIGFYEGDHFVTEQLFLREPEDEPAVLSLLSRRAASRRALCTFNGKSFDRPVLATRYVLNRADPVGALAPEAPHIDLLAPCRRLYRRRIGSCRLAAIEANLLGIVRHNDVAGWDVSHRYRAYLGNGDTRALGGVFEHNRIDVLSMTTLATYALSSYALLHEHIPYDDLVGCARLALSARDLTRARAALELASATRPEELWPWQKLSALHERHTRNRDLALTAAQRSWEVTSRLEGPAADATLRAARRVSRLRRLAARLFLPFDPEVFLPVRAPDRRPPAESPLATVAV